MKSVDELAEEYCENNFGNMKVKYHAFKAGHASRDEEVAGLNRKLSEVYKHDEGTIGSLNWSYKKIESLQTQVALLEKEVERYKYLHKQHLKDAIFYKEKLAEMRNK